MNYQFSKLIEEIESEIGHQYLGGAIAWSDAKYDGAWSKAIDAFDLALGSGDPEKITFQAAQYRQTIFRLLGEYKASRSVDRAVAFFEMVKKGQQTT